MERESNVPTYRTHRVGSVTAGLSMVAFGVMLLLHSLLGIMSYSAIFSWWPLILIGMGIELLISNFLQRKVIYDKAAVFLLIVMTLFVMIMAVADICMKQAVIYW